MLAISIFVAGPIETAWDETSTSSNQENAISIGRMHVVGVGPGDPQLLTLKAAAVLGQAEVVYHAGPAPDQGRALQIARSLIRPDARVRSIRTSSMHEAIDYRAAVEQMAGDCRSGLAVVYMTEGDPTLYSTAAHVWQLLREYHPDIPFEIISGISSVTAAAARVGWPLALQDQPIVIGPARRLVKEMPSWLQSQPMVCLLKPARMLGKLAPSDRYEAAYVENLGTDNEWITHNLAEAVGRDEYFSVVLWRQRVPDRQPESEGKLWIVGIGPGETKHLTQQAQAILQSVDVIIGYDGYFKHIESLATPGRRMGSPIGSETERARQGLELAAAGERVAVISSGDAGVYGMASLILEQSKHFPEVDVEVVPGVTAALAAAALLGAPLGHDFACISLSDLLTPWPEIERRLEAAAQGDFVIALYNPVSRQRNWQLPRARAILLRHRDAGTPVGIVDRAYRHGTQIRQTSLGGLTVDGIGMETALIVGNRQTRWIQGRMVTPRGYPTTTTQPAEKRGNTPSNSHIIEESFAIIDREVGRHSLSPWEYAVARRMIHASADFDFLGLLRASPGFEDAIRQALQNQAAIVADTEMVAIGLRTIAQARSVSVICYLNDSSALPNDTSLTRSAAGIRLACRRHPQPILAIGNAPTALSEALRLVREEGWRPRAVIAMPVGFVGVEDAKRQLVEQLEVPYLTCTGRKGGSAVTAAAVNALLEFFHV